jgi:hypothetical protein
MRSSLLSKSDNAGKPKERSLGEIRGAIRICNLTAILIGALLAGSATHAEVDVEQIVAQKV